MPYVKTDSQPASNPTSLEAYALAYKEQLHAKNYAQQSVEYKFASLGLLIGAMIEASTK
jgi:hypothetical protein